MTNVLNLTNLASPTGDDIIYIVDDPTGSPLDRKATVTALAGSVAFSSVYAALTSLPNVAPTSDIIPDAVTSPGDLLWNLGDEIGKNNDLTIRIAQGARLAAASVATIGALPSVTYVNGAAGIGATLTGTAVGALANQDHITLVTGNWILVKNQVAATQNGLYEVTTAGDGATAFILTRVPCADEQADYLAGIVVLIGAGVTNAGSTFTCQGDVVMNTDPILWQGQQRTDSSQADSLLGANRNRLRYFTDFEEMPFTAITATGSLIPGTPHTVYFSGANSQAVNVVAAPNLAGVCEVSTGSTATGFAMVRLGNQSGVGNVFSTATRASASGRFITPTLSSAVEEFTCYIGLHNALTGAAPTSGLYFEAPPTVGSTYLAVANNLGVRVAVDTLIAQAITIRSWSIVYDPVTLTANYYLQSAGAWSLVASISTSLNLPNGVAIPASASIRKTAGLTSRALRMDMLGQDMPNNRIVLEMI